MYIFTGSANKLETVVQCEEYACSKLGQGSLPILLVTS